MNPRIIIVVFASLVFVSCNSSGTQDKQIQQPPKALEDKTASFDVISRSGPGDLVESLYNELANNTSELKGLENRLEDLARSKDDSTASFDTYNGKNQSYFDAADGHIAQIKDSVLREKMKVLIAGNLVKYKAGISKHKALLELINKKALSLNDLHIVLKITRTLPLIEKYQLDKYPSPKPIDGYLQQLEGAIQYTDTLIKR